MTVDDILRTEFSEEFVKGMRDRMAVSFYKYGPLSEAYPHKVDAITVVGQYQKRNRRCRIIFRG